MRLDSERFKLLWDFKIETDHHIEHNKPDILLLNKEGRSCWIIDIACPFDIRIVNKEREKVENYHDLKIEIKLIWNCRSVKIIPIIIGALGTISRDLSYWKYHVAWKFYSVSACWVWEKFKEKFWTHKNSAKERL